VVYCLQTATEIPQLENLAFEDGILKISKISSPINLTQKVIQ